MMITQDTVQKVAALARLELTPDEERQFTEQLGAILGYVERLADVDVSGVAPTAQPMPVMNVLREDRLQESLSRDEVLQNAPAVEEGMFRVPQIIGEA